MCVCVYVCINLLFVCMIVKILTHLYLEKWENFWKNQGILSVKKSGNPVKTTHEAIQIHN